MDILSILLVAFLIGIVIGMTGMGGGALMTPALIFLGIPPTVAVANDLVAAAFSKSAGAITHWKKNKPNLKLAGWLVVGSVPFAFAGGFIIDAIASGHAQEVFVKTAIGAALILASLTYTLRIFITYYREPNKQTTEDFPHIKPLRTAIIGAIGGLLVGLTSVGSGSLILVMLLLIYPTIKTTNLVGTDLAQAVPLVIAAAAGHVITGGLQFDVLIPLIIGSVPGTIVGARVAGKVKQKVLRRSIVVVLLFTGLALLGVPTVVNLVIGLIVLLLGPWIMSFPSKIRDKRRMQASDSF